MESVLKPCAGLWEALELEPERCPILCLAGAGGKTTAMYRLAEEAAARGLRVCVTTTTRIWCPGDERRVLLLERRAEELKGKCLPGQVLTAGVPAEPGKLKGLSPEETAGLLEFCDLLLIEADGSKRFPFKVPAAWEPVILKAVSYTHLSCRRIERCRFWWAPCHLKKKKSSRQNRIQ